MSFFVGSNETVADKISSADTLMRAAPDYYAPRFEAIKELRDSDDGTLHKGNEFRRVASLVNVPLMTALKIIEPDFTSNKRKFYDWLDKHPEYCTYQRPSRLGRAAQVVRDIGNMGKVFPLEAPALVVPVTEG